MTGGRDAVTEALAAYAVGLDVTALDPDVRTEVSRRLVDSLACAYGALDAEPVVALRAVAAERPLADGCTVWGTGARTTPELAALANGTAVRFLDYSDYTAGGHPSDNVAAVVAACEWADATVDDLVAGIVVSYEVWGELGRLYLRYRGWDQGTTAAIAAVCAVGRVLGLDHDQLADAIGIVAASHVSLFTTRRGEISAWKAVAVPFAAQSALLAASLAAKGVSGPPAAFAGEYGFFAQVSGEFAVEGLAQGSRPRTLFATGYKHWPVEYEAQFAVWLAQRIRDKVPVDEIEHLDLYTSEWTWSVIADDPEKWAPTTRETADHSLPYIVAVALERGRIDHDDFDPAVLATPAYASLMARMSVHADADITANAHERCAFRGVVRTTGGEEIAFEIDEPRSQPITDEQLDDKWSRLSGGSRLADTAPELLASLHALDGSVRVRALFASLARD